MPIIDVNMGSIVKFSDKLERIHRAALPNTVRSTLNNAAFYTKKKTLLEETGRQFIKRKPSFFRAFSRVKKATGFSIKNMRSIVGMTDGSQSSINLQFQERGGTISGRDIIPMDAARVGGNKSKVISKRIYLKNIRNKTINVNESKARTKKQKFVRSAIIAAKKFGRDGYVETDDSIVKITRTRKPFWRTRKVYDKDSGRSVKLTRRPFLEPAAKKSQKLMPQWFKKEGKRQLARFAR